MNSANSYSPLPNACAEDDEIRRYAGLLDSLGVGLMVFSSDASPFLNNNMAGKLLGGATPNWLNESGQTMVNDDLPLTLALRTSQPVFDCIMALTNEQAHTTWLSVNALPVFSENGSVRRVLLTLDDLTRLKDLQREIGDLTTHDPLTGAFNHRFITQLLENEIHRAQRYGTPFTVAQLDVDFFQSLCQKHGQEKGELVLAGIGKLLRESVREMDMVGRIGNDEFLLILPNVRLNDAIIGMERLRSLIELQAVTDDRLFVTVSGGITEYSGENSTAILERSKSLLINAREAGRNRFCLDPDIL
ncbi:GGDEF domain-containing protein [Propionivibrio sp.]|uniref:GGDEF domain-containing protein n=1 Tax=Propionivibrio sp. TaxID=2212460 RepID=UPI00262D1CEA|nr:GGDEF domain-containing protein [Propionivibrio sp.]